MSTLQQTKPSYQEMQKRITRDFRSLRLKKNGKDAVTNRLLYWNRMVKTAERWQGIIDKKVTDYSRAKSLRLHVKNSLLAECRKAIREISAIRPTDNEARAKRRYIIEELKDRQEYIAKYY